MVKLFRIGQIRKIEKREQWQKLQLQIGQKLNNKTKVADMEKLLQRKKEVVKCEQTTVKTVRKLNNNTDKSCRNGAYPQRGGWLPANTGLAGGRVLDRSWDPLASSCADPCRRRSRSVASFP